jgi:hypothetical protein
MQRSLLDDMMPIIEENDSRMDIKLKYTSYYPYHLMHWGELALRMNNKWVGGISSDGIELPRVLFSKALDYDAYKRALGYLLKHHCFGNQDQFKELYIACPIYESHDILLAVTGTDDKYDENDNNYNDQLIFEQTATMFDLVPDEAIHIHTGLDTKGSVSTKYMTYVAFADSLKPHKQEFRSVRSTNKFKGKDGKTKLRKVQMLLVGTMDEFQRAFKEEADAHKSGKETIVG